jgi:maleate isomerase
MESKKIDPKFNKYQNPKIGLIALASDYMIEKDFIKIIKDKKETIQKKIKNAKPEAIVTTPSTASIKALKKLNIKKIAIFTPYSKKLNDEVLDFFKNENFEIKANSYFNIESDIDIGKVDPNYLYEVLSKMDLKGAEALFVSCTALPALSIIDKLEKKLNITVLSSNQTLIWDTLNSIKNKETTKGFGKIFEVN